MRLVRYILPVICLAGILATSCKKDEEKTEKSLKGGITIDIPTYVRPGDVLTFIPDSTTTGDNVYTNVRRLSDDPGPLGYAVSIVSFSVVDTLVRPDGTPVGSGIYKFTVPDTLLTFEISFRAFAEGYYSVSASRGTTIVKPGLDGKGSLTGFKYSEGAPTMTDPRDGRTYFTTEAGGKTWMRSNLAYFEKDAKGYTFGMPRDGSEAIEEIFGGYYTWEEAKKACPAGWRVPTEADWDALGTVAGDLIADIRFNGNEFWEFWPEVKITDKTGLSIIPGGYASVDKDDYSFKGTSSYALFWSDKGGEGYSRYIYASEPDVKSDFHPGDNFAANLRCVKE